MKSKLAVILWKNGSGKVSIEEVLTFVEDDRFFIEVNDGKDLTCGVEIR